MLNCMGSTFQETHSLRFLRYNFCFFCGTMRSTVLLCQWYGYKASIQADIQYFLLYIPVLKLNPLNFLTDTDYDSKHTGIQRKSPKPGHTGHRYCQNYLTWEYYIFKSHVYKIANGFTCEHDLGVCKSYSVPRGCAESYCIKSDSVCTMHNLWLSFISYMTHCVMWW